LSNPALAGLESDVRIAESGKVKNKRLTFFKFRNIKFHEHLIGFYKKSGIDKDELSSQPSLDVLFPISSFSHLRLPSQ
jgi:hypothetical protein